MKEFKIDNKSSGQTLYRFIKNILPGIINRDIFKLIRKKIITVNNKKQSSNYILNNEDVIGIYLNDAHFETKGKKVKFHSVNKNFDIIFENNDLLVVNKPKGLLTHPDRNDYKNNVYEFARAYLYSRGEYEPENLFSPAPCHRLDKNTSGLVIIAKNHAALRDITKKLRERKTTKIYKAIVYGRINNEILITSSLNTEDEKVISSNVKIIENIPDDKIRIPE